MRVRCDGPGCEEEIELPIELSPEMKKYCSIECACYDGSMSVRVDAPLKTE